MKEPTLTITSDFTDNFKQILNKFKQDAVLVGIPESESVRDKMEEEGPISNAALLAINNFGSENLGIPPRSVMKIGIQNAKEEIAQQFKLAAQIALTKGPAALEIYYGRSGFIAANSIKKVINDQEGIKEPSAATLATRKSAGFKGTKALVVTGQMRNAITYVVRSIWGK